MMVSDQGRLFPDEARRRRGRARRGLDDTLRALRETGRLENVDAALLALCRVAADELDAAAADMDESRYTRGVLIARYHSVLTHLLARPDAGDTDGFLEDLFTAVGDTPAG
jgi:hypothetical protein